MKKLIAVAFSVGLALCFCEIALRMFWPQPTGPVQFFFDSVRGAIPTPNQKGRRVVPGIFAYTFSNNSLGLRGPEIGPKTHRRILLVGDSFTYGFGVNDDETFAFRLQTMTGDEVINGGNGGTGTDYALRFYETVGKTLQPDLVVLCFFPNDFQDNERSAFYDNDLRPRDLSLTTPARKHIFNNVASNWVLEHSQLANLIKVNVIRTGLWQVSGPFDENHINAELTRRYVDALEARVRENHAEFLVLYLPSDRDVEKFRAGSGSTSENALKSIHSSVSLTQPLANSNYRIDQLYFPSEGHWTAIAHALAAQAIAPLLSGNGLTN
jgi:lysophospholipase L1-like esterase